MILSGTGLSLEMAATVATNGRAISNKVKVETAVDRFVRQRNGERAWRPSTAEWFDRRLLKFAQQFGERSMDDIRPADVKAWLDAMKLGARPGYFRAVRALFSWAVRQDPPMAVASPTSRMEVPKSQGREGDIHFLSVDECENVLAGAGPYLCAIALGLFAGLRPEEVAPRDKPGLQWSHVNEAEKRVRVPGDVAKVTGQARVIEGLPATLWSWLRTIPKDQKVGAVSPGRSSLMAQVIKRALGWKLLPHDIVRHTFATYAAAHTQDPGQVATWLGHQGNPTMLFNHYNGLTTKADAKRFWAIRQKRN